MKVSNASALWEGSIREGHGTMKLEQGNYEGPYSYASRFEQGKGTSPEELLGAAHAGCFSMALTADLTRAGFKPESVQTEAKVYLDAGAGGAAITKIELQTTAKVPDIDDATFQQHAAAAKKNCPLSKALASIEIELTAQLAS